MFYINHIRTPPFTIGLVKTESGFIVTSIELTWLREMKSGGSCDWCWWLSFFGFLRPDLTPWGYSNRCFLVALWRLIVTKLGSGDQKASTSAARNTSVVLVPCSHMEVRPYSYFWWCGCFWGPWVSFVLTDEFSVRVTKIISRIGVSWTHSLLFYF